MNDSIVARAEFRFLLNDGYCGDAYGITIGARIYETVIWGIAIL